MRREGVLEFLRPDGKTQVSIEYEDDVPKRLVNVVISTQHAPGINIDRDLRPAHPAHFALAGTGNTVWIQRQEGAGEMFGGAA